MDVYFNGIGCVLLLSIVLYSEKVLPFLFIWKLHDKCLSGIYILSISDNFPVCTCTIIRQGRLVEF